MKNTKTSIILIVSIMVIVGTTLTPTLHQRVTAVAIEARSQHMDQENLCYRANICRQANDGQNTLGNDNSITGFVDQSDNLQQAAVPTPITPTNQTTGNQTSGGGGGGTTNCVTVTISGLVSGVMNQTASVQVCLIPDVITTVDIPGIGPTLVVLSTDGCPRGFVDTQITAGRFHLCATLVRGPDRT
jgi:hypothetical protein